MQRMSRLLLLWLLVSSTTGFDLPDIRDFFMNLAGPGQSSAQSEGHGDRNKRQSRSSIGDEMSSDPYIVRSSNVPTIGNTNKINTRYMPTLGNGHIATTVYGDALYMEGLYVGTGASTRRARIPPGIMAQIELSDWDLDRQSIRKYEFDSKYGIFTETVTTDFAEVQQSMYMHQKFMRLFVVDLYARKKQIGQEYGGSTILRKFPKINATDDIRFNSEPVGHYANWQIKGKAKSSEDGVNPDTVSIFWSTPLEQFIIRGLQKEYNDTLVMSVDKHEGNARSEFDEALRIINTRGPAYLLKLHKEAWDKVWNEGRVELAGNQRINKISNFAQYYLLSSLPAEFPQTGAQIDDIYSGVSRTSLAKGGKEGKDFQGHIMWDNEMYILPAVLLFHPETVKKVLRYRVGTAQAAKKNAEDHGAEGYHFAWESARSGFDTSSDAETCPDCSWKKYHVTGAVAWAFRQYYSATRDDDFRTSMYYNSCDMTREIARFFANRAQYNTEYGRYDLNDVTGPDETHPNVRNNAYTTVMASLAIHWARYYACVCNRNTREEVPDDWVHKATLFNLPFDNVKRLHYAFEGFDSENSRVHQADTILLSYPLYWNMSRDIMKNDLEYYERITDDNTPAMTWSFFTVGYKMVKDEAKMMSFFAQSYQDYIQEPFKVWTQYKEGFGASESAVNFLPGMGAFLQSIIYGFAGIRIRPQMLEFFDPRPPPETGELRLLGLKYLGTKMNIVIRQTGQVTITVIEEAPTLPLVLRANTTTATEQSLRAGAEVIIDNAQNGFFIYTLQIDGCEHPRDYIYMPWGYSPFVDAAPVCYPSSLLTSCVAIMAVLASFWCL